VIGRTLDDRYLILRQIGQGGMGAVYEARHVGTNRRVAVKVILKEAMMAEQIARFQREARIVGAVESQHITQVFDTGVDRATGCPYIAMEYLDGDDAGALLRKTGPLPIDLAMRIASQACAGLARAHDAGVVHRDIKSGNLFLHKNEPGSRIVKLLDFGIAKVGHELGDGGLTKTGALVGSPLYMSPEQARGRPVDPRSDIFSLGITLYEMLGGRRPNEEITQLGELIVKICSEPARWIQDVAPWVPAELAGIVHKAVAIEPSARYQSAAEFAAALRAMLPMGHHIEETMLVPIDPALRSRTAPRGSPLANTGNPRALSVGGVSSSGTTTVGQPKSSAAGFVIGGAIAALALGGGVAFYALRNRGPEAAPTSVPAASAPSGATSVASGSPTITPAPTASETASAAGSAGPSAAPTSASAAPTTASAAPGPTASANVKAPIKTNKPIKKSDDETSRH
jgi:serine/threonine-protein kinase